jgi:hypothetical protein
MKIGNGADTRELRRAVQMEKRTISSQWEPTKKVQSRSTCIVWDAGLQIQLIQQAEKWKKWVKTVIVLGGLTEDVKVWRVKIQSTDHELIPAKNASLAAMQSSASGSNIRYSPMWKNSPLKEGN